MPQRFGTGAAPGPAASSPPAPPDDGPAPRPAARPRHTLVALCAFCVVLAGSELSILTAAGWDAGPLALWESIVVLYFASGLIALWRQPHNPFGSLLLLGGLVHWCAGMLTVPVLGLTMVGSLTRSLPLAVLIHLILAFPTGRLTGRPARVAVGLAYVTSTVLEVPAALLGPAGPLPTPAAGPVAGGLALLGALQRPAGLICLALAMVAMWSRWISRRRYRDDRLGPFVLYGFACLLGLALTVLVRLLVAVPLVDPAVLQRVAELQGYLIALLPVVFLLGLLTGAYGRTGELREFFADVGGGEPSAADLDAAVARAAALPGSRVIYQTDEPGEFVEADGSPAVVAAGERRYPIRSGPRVVGAVVHPSGADVDATLLAAVAAASAPVVDHRRAVVSRRAALLELRRTDRALRQSRRRIASAGDRERRRIARDLHDGLQQHALALGLQAQELRLVRRDPDAVAATADALRDGIVALLAALRDLVQGIMPAPLVERGVVSAVKELAGRLPVPITVEVAGHPRRLPAEIESTVYFVVLEAITNAIKHARCTAITVGLDLGADRVVAQVADDGTGGATVGAGSGLVGLRDRLAAFGGTLEVTSAPGAGTAVRMMVPCG
ncbi:sensor histidine kinase [Nakamurella sp.]|uniref:sensor histidine kinase n=1 Tax=Nakamurella sp. TaxID=1869182 RepID=UPI003B3B2D9B